MSAAADEIGEVSGPAFSPVEVGAALFLGVVGLLISGLLAVLLGALAEEHRLSASGIGQLAMIEALCTGLAAGAAGALLKPSRLRVIGAAAAAALTAANLMTVGASGAGLMLVRAAAGVSEGVLLWITIGLIARTTVPERWAGVLFTTMPLAQAAYIGLLSAWVLPRFGADGAYRALAVASALAIPVALIGPSRLGALPGAGRGDASDRGLPPPLGWAALAATLAFVAAMVAGSLYAVPLARQAGLDVSVARTAIGASLVCQVLGGAIATALAGRVHYLAVFAVSTAIFLAAWTVLGSGPPGWAFVSACAFAGLAGALSGPFLVPMTIAADPTRRTAMQSGGVQLLAGALGPLLASFAVAEHDSRGALVLAAGLLLAGAVGFVLVSRSVRPPLLPAPAE